jgi:hypothetical protein
MKPLALTCFQFVALAIASLRGLGEFAGLQRCRLQERLARRSRSR